MSAFERIQQRTDTYANWENQNNNTPGGLKIMQGEICVVLADSASAAAGLSNIIADTTTPLTERFANTGEVLGTKVGQGFTRRWDEIPLNFHLPNINYPNGGGRVLGTRTNGGTHVYNHPGKALRAVFAPVYSPPTVGLSLRYGGGSDLNGALVEIGQSVGGVYVQADPGLRTYRIKNGRVFEVTQGATELGQDETANAPDTIGSFQRAPAAPFALTPANASYNGGAGCYTRTFYADVTDDRPGNEGGPVQAGSNNVGVNATYPMYFGKSAAALPTDPAALGAWLQANCTPQLRYRQNFDVGNVAYANGEHAIYAHPAVWGPLGAVRNVLGLNELEAGGAFAQGPRNGLLTKAALYNGVPYLVYVSAGGYNGTIFFNFQF